MECRLLQDLGKLWASRDYQRTHKYFERSLELARLVNDGAVLAGSLNWMGNWYANDENPGEVAAFHQEALAIFEELGDHRGLARTLDLLGIANLLGGDLSASVEYYDRAIALYQELDDLTGPRLQPDGPGNNSFAHEFLATAPAVAPPDARRDFEEAIQITREIHSPQGSLGVLDAGLVLPAEWSVWAGLGGRQKRASSSPRKSGIASGWSVTGLPWGVVR